MTTPTLDTVAEAMERRRAQVREYGTYVATAAIDINGVRAFNPGDPVPVSHVERFGYLEDGVVARRGTPFDPAEHTADEVKARLATADEAERARIRDAERAGKNRSTVIEAAEPTAEGI